MNTEAKQPTDNIDKMERDLIENVRKILRDLERLASVNKRCSSN